MPTITIGSTAIDYRVERNASTRLRKIIVTPDEVRVIAPEDDAEGEVREFLDRKRAWLYQNYRQVAEIAERRPRTLRFMTGSKVPYRGRMMRLTVTRGDAPVTKVFYKNGFHVTAPHNLSPKNWDREIWAALRTWLFDRARSDAKSTAMALSARIGLNPQRVTIREMENAWGSCSPTGIINLDWRLIFAPAAVLRYAVAHELAHLQHRSHSDAFWRLVDRLDPGYAEAKSWLESTPAILNYAPPGVAGNTSAPLNWTL